MPRFPARRRMPLQAVALKKNRCGTAVVSKISDKEDAAAALWNSEVLSVKHAPCEAVRCWDARNDAAVLPAFLRDGEALAGEDSQKARKVLSSIARKDAGDVLPDQPAGPISASNVSIGEHEVATRIIQSFSEAGDGEGLAGSSAHKELWVEVIGPCVVLGHIAQVGHVRVVVRE